MKKVKKTTAQCRYKRKFSSIWNIYNDSILAYKPITNRVNEFISDYNLVEIPIEANAQDNDIKYTLHPYLDGALKQVEKNDRFGAYISDMKINSKGDIFLSLTNQHQIWKKSPQKEAQVIGGYIKYFEETRDDRFETKEGFKDGKGGDSLFRYPTGMAIDGQDNLYIADTGNNAIRKIMPDGVVSTFYVEKGGN